RRSSPSIRPPVSTVMAAASIFKSPPVPQKTMQSTSPGVGSSGMQLAPAKKNVSRRWGSAPTHWSRCGAEMAIECSLKPLRGIDPLEEGEAEKRAKATAAVKTIIFEKAAVQYIAAHQAGWKSPVHRQQWKNTLVRLPGVRQAGPAGH